MAWLPEVLLADGNDAFLDGPFVFPMELCTRQREMRHDVPSPNGNFRWILTSPPWNSSTL